MKRNLRRYLLAALALPALAALIGWVAPERVGDLLYDMRHRNPPVTSKAEVDRILSGFRRVRPADLPAGYLHQSGMQAHPGYRPTVFYVVDRKDLHRRIVGRNRLRQLLCRDLRYRSSFFTSDRRLYLGIDPDILHKAIELQHSLRANGYDPDAVRINSGHRTPSHNRIVGGARGSRHQRGDALDLRIGDVDRNGWTDRRDKAIVLRILDGRIIGSRGGLGLYPGTQTVHMDLRGYRARWNSH
jgi:hypothetical protein